MPTIDQAKAMARPGTFHRVSPVPSPAMRITASTSS